MGFTPGHQIGSPIFHKASCKQIALHPTGRPWGSLVRQSLMVLAAAQTDSSRPSGEIPFGKLTYSDTWRY